MNIIFPAVDESYIKAKVGDGFYGNATELVRDAVRRLRENDDRHYAQLVAALNVGEQAVKRGQTKPYTAALLKKIERDARRAAAKGEPINPDVRA